MKIKIFLILLLAVSFYSVNCSKKNPLGPATPNTISDNYIPLGMGYTRQYNNYSLSNTKFDTTTYSEITFRGIAPNKKTYYELDEKTKTPSGTITDSDVLYIRKDSTGYYQYDPFEVGADAEALIIKLPLVKGSSWTALNYSGSIGHTAGNISINIVNSYIADETITNGADTFVCVKIKTDWNYTITLDTGAISESHSGTSYDWYANNVGKVKSQDEDGYSLLSSYTIHL